jgi:hypothetical protein
LLDDLNGSIFGYSYEEFIPAFPGARVSPFSEYGDAPIDSMSAEGLASHLASRASRWRLHVLAVQHHWHRGRLDTFTVTGTKFVVEAIKTDSAAPPPEPVVMHTMDDGTVDLLSMLQQSEARGDDGAEGARTKGAVPAKATSKDELTQWLEDVMGGHWGRWRRVCNCPPT